MTDELGLRREAILFETRARSGQRRREALGGRIVALARRAIETAFQPIVEIETGQVHGCEALLRGHDRLGMASPTDLLDLAARAGESTALDQLLQSNALARFAAGVRGGEKLFLNLDGRALDADLTLLDGLIAATRRNGVAAANVVIELSERQNHLNNAAFPQFMRRLREAGFRIAVDDFGIGYSELRLLCDFGLDYIKIDGSFVRGMAGNDRRRLFVETLTNLAHVLGVRVIAEGVEDANDHLAVREAGCDLIQGWYVARPTTVIEDLPKSFDHVRRACPVHRRAGQSDSQLVRAKLEVIPPLAVTAPLEVVFEAFRRNPGRSFFPVVAADGSPAAIVHERDLKSFIYNPFGRDLLRNRTNGRGLSHFLTQTPVADIGFGIERMLDVFAHSGGADCVVVTENMAYLGVLSASALLEIMSEKTIRKARDQNPLTELPGNRSICERVAETVSDGGQTRWLCWFDFDHFKPFNDRYGFGHGDKAIRLFASVLRRHLAGTFIGHVGGDDFFAALEGESEQAVRIRIEAALAEFARLVVDLYDPADRVGGGIRTRDRQGTLRLHPPMRCSAAVLELPEGWTTDAPDPIGGIFAELKSRAKRSSGGLVFARSDDTTED